MRFVNLRETAGWSADAAGAGPKMAALAAAASLPVPEVPFVQIESAGVLLVYGRDERAVEAAGLLKDALDVTVLISRPGEVAPPRTTDFPIVKGTIRTASGHLGAFDLVVDDYAVPLPSSRAALKFAPARDGARSHCDIVLDISGGAPLFPAADLRDGYLRADPGDPAAILRAVLRARDLVGSFDKPRYVSFTAELCAHSRSGIVGCHRCLDLCPTSAIVPAGDHVAIDATICAGCGQCAAACPTGAASYALPPADALLRTIRTLLVVYRDAGGLSPVLLLHDEDARRRPDRRAGAARRRAAGECPAARRQRSDADRPRSHRRVLCLRRGGGARSAAREAAARSRRPVSDDRARRGVLAGLGFEGERVGTIETDDPFALGDALRRAELGEPVARPASFEPMGGRRDVLRLALRELHRVAPAPADVILLPADAPFGAVEINVEGCTLCLSCVSACPTGALSDDPDRPVLRFSEDACVQCGLCKATCPEKVISLVPRLAFGAALATRVLKEEEPFPCIRCGKPFGVKSAIDRVTAKLEGRHWMYQNAPDRLDLIKMCEDCRVIAVTEAGFDPHAAPERPRPRTTDDYLRERERKRDS